MSTSRAFEAKIEEANLSDDSLSMSVAWRDHSRGLSQTRVHHCGETHKISETFEIMPRSHASLKILLA
jgi:hypothetical protein